MTDETKVDGVTELESALRTMVSQLDRETERAMGIYADDLRDRAAKFAARAGRLATMAAGGLTSGTRSGGGELSAAGGGTLPTGSGTYAAVFFGAEWGGGSRPETRQFKPYRETGYWFYPAVREAYATRLTEDVIKLGDHAGKVWAD